MYQTFNKIIIGINSATSRATTALLGSFSRNFTRMEGGGLTS
jgi:hypothetical protein